MIFVTIGTQKQEFKRIFELIENSLELKNEEIIAQSGYTNFKSERIDVLKFLETDKYDEMIKKSDFVICHGGVGSIFSALLENKKVLAIPRLKKYSEHVDDHQIEICEELEKLNYIIYYKDGEDFDECIKKIRTTEFKEYLSDDSFVEKLKKEI